MAQENSSLFGERLKTARKMAGLSLQDLEDKLNKAVTKQALSRYELGVMEPTGRVLIALATVLQVKVDYFFKKDAVQLGEVAFRKRTGLSKKDEDAIIEQARDFVGRYLTLESLLGAELHFQNPLEGRLIESFEDVEKAAGELRDHWGLGSGPIANVLEVLEEKGIKIFMVEASEKFDGVATIANHNVPVIVINKSQVERMRFTAVHETAHVLLNLSPAIKSDDDLVEKYCHYFASCFLLPTDKFIAMIGGKKRSYIVIDELISIKENSGISLRAQLYRAMQMEMISNLYYKKWSVYLTKKYGSKKEPGDYPGIEKPKRFDRLLNRALVEEIISVSKAATLANTPVSELNQRLSEMPQ